MNFIKKIYQSLSLHHQKNVLCIDGTFYTYQDFSELIGKIRFVIQNHIPQNQKLIGLVTNDDLFTYASITALWFEGKAYVPVNPATPQERNQGVFVETDTKFVLDSSENSQFIEEYTVFGHNELSKDTIFTDPKTASEDDLAYILFTSGTTGKPKGVPITFKNLQALVDAIDADELFELKSSDRCLQMFELTFDFSLVTYVFPLLAGACMYTIPKGAIKYFYIFKLIQNHKLTVLTMVPSIINYLRPYFSEILAPDVRYCSFGGGALQEEIAKEWSDCLPNCEIFNYYGPTEYTVYSGYYPFDKVNHTKSNNGIVAIGKPLKGVTYLLVDENNNEVSTGITGELCLAGDQMTTGYWNNPSRNLKSFFTMKKDEKSCIYYKTGDLCYKDHQGDYLYVGRADFQVKIRGYRVELAEIEHHARNGVSQKVAIVALDIQNNLGNAELGLAIASKPFDTNEVLEYMKSKLPDYMIPRHIQFVDDFPHSINGKIDRKVLKKLFKI